jgi:hypothetical protein
MSETVVYILPAYWASALVNCDDSGLEDGERQVLEAWCKRTNTNYGTCLNVGEPYYARSNDAGTLAGDVAEYLFPEEAD